jgi:hypothetical protein
MKFSAFLKVEEATKGMLDIKSTNLAKMSGRAITKLVDQDVEISEKFDGTKLTLIRTKEEYKKGDSPLKYWLVSFKNNLLTSQEFENVSREDAKEQSLSNAQYSFVFDHLKELDPSQFQTNREYFVEYLMRKPTLIVKYAEDMYHNFMLIGYGDNANPVVEGLRVSTSSGELKQEGLDEEAAKMKMLSPPIVFKGKISNFSAGLVKNATGLYKERKQKQINEIRENYERHKELLESDDPDAVRQGLNMTFLNVTSIFSNKRNDLDDKGRPTIEGFMIKGEKFVKVQDPKITNKDFRLAVKLQNSMDREAENEYFAMMNEKSRELLEKKPNASLRDFSNYVYNDPKGEIQAFYDELVSKFQDDDFANRKPIFHVKDQLMIELKIVIGTGVQGKGYEGFVLIPGRYNPATAAHIQKMFIENGLEKYPNYGVIVQLVKGKGTGNDVVKNPFDLKFQKEWIKKAVKGEERIMFFEFPSADLSKLIPNIEKSGKKVKALVAGEDRAQGYKNQLSSLGREDIVFEPLTRSDDNISATALKLSLLKDDEEAFKANAHPTHHKEYANVRDKFLQILNSAGIAPEQAIKELEG